MRRKPPTRSGTPAGSVITFSSWKRRLAFSGSHREKRGGLLLHILTAAMWTLGMFFFVLIQGKNSFEGLVTIEADIIVNGHGDLPWKC